MTNREIEDRAIAVVIAHERGLGRTAVDMRGRSGSPVDVESSDDATGATRLIEIKAFGGAGRGEDLWLEPAQVEALSKSADSHLYLVTHVRSADASDIRILDLSGQQLRERLEAKRERHYYAVPLPTALYDQLYEDAGPRSTEDENG